MLFSIGNTHQQLIAKLKQSFMAKWSSRPSSLRSSQTLEHLDTS